FFEENPEGIQPSVQRSITEIVFNLKIQLAQYLKKFPDDDEFTAFRNELLTELHKTVSQLDTDRFDVKMKLKTVLDYGGDNRSLWDHLDNKDIKVLEDEIALLIKPPKGDNDLARFYVR